MYAPKEYMKASVLSFTDAQPNANTASTTEVRANSAAECTQILKFTQVPELRVTAYPLQLTQV